MNYVSLETKRNHRVNASILCVIALGLGACHKGAGEAPKDSPQLTPKVTMQDVTFYSRALQRDMPYRVVMPSGDTSGRKLKTVYLLHGGGGGFRDWTNYSDVAKYAEHGLILVMPEGHSSYYANAAEPQQDRYEDYIVKDLIEDVERKFPTADSREGRAIVGVSMGGFGAINLALRHPGLFAFAGGISAAVDVPTRPFSIKRLEQWRRFRAIFGPWEGYAQKSNDPYVLVRSVEVKDAPYFFLTCGEQEGLLGANRRFASLLEARHFQYEFHTTQGDHNWEQWDRWLTELFQSLEQHLHSGAAYPSDSYRGGVWRRRGARAARSKYLPRSQTDLRGVVNVGEGIGGEQDEVGTLSGRDRDEDAPETFVPGAALDIRRPLDGVVFLVDGAENRSLVCRGAFYL